MIRMWQVHTLYFSETLPAKWDWSLSTAVAKWNASGGGIRFVRTVSSSAGAADHLLRQHRQGRWHGDRRAHRATRWCG